MQEKQMYIQYLYEISVLEERKKFFEELAKKEREKYHNAKERKKQCSNSQFTEKKFAATVDLKEVPDIGTEGFGGFLALLVSPILLIANPALLFGLAISLAVVAAIIWFVAIVYVFHGDESALSYKSVLLGLCLVCYILWVLIGVISGKDDKENREKIIEENAKKERRFQERKQRFEENQKLAHKEFLENKAKELESLEKEIGVYYKNCSIYVKEMMAVKDLLDKYYEVGILYPKYRRYHAVLTILQYLQSKRCAALDGPDGAYNLYEREMRMDTVIEQLKVTNSLMVQLVKHTENMVAGINSIGVQMASVTNRLDEIQYSLLRQQDLMSQYNISMMANTEAIYQIESNMGAMKSIEELNIIQQQQTNALLEYQNFAIQQQRLNSGYWN